MSEYPVHIKVLPHVHLIRGENRAKFPQANTLLIDDEILTLVDAGSSMNNIESTLRDLDYSFKDIERIILTHYHIDHKGHAAQIQDISDCELICHPLAVKGVKTFEGMVDYYGIAGNKYYDSWKYLLETRFNHVVVDYNVTGTFNENREIDCGETRLLPLHLPGHTIDHTCFGINDYKTLFLVDIDLTRFGPWYGNRVSDIEVFKESIEKVIELKPSTGISSHLINPISQGLDKRLIEYRAIFDKREARIIENIKHGINTIEALAKEPTIYPKIPMDAYYIFEIFMIEKHVELLEKNGVISIEDGKLSIQKR